MKSPKICWFLAIVLACCFAVDKVQAQFPFEYDWTTNTPGFSGKIFLDSSSNANGSLANMDLAQSFITTPDGTFHFQPFAPTLLGPLVWNSSFITSMNISGYQVFNDMFSGLIQVRNNDINDQIILFDIEPFREAGDTGSWLAAFRTSAVPEGSSSISLLILALLSLGAFRFRLTRAANLRE